MHIPARIFAILFVVLAVAEGLSIEETLDNKVRRLNELTANQPFINLKNDQFQMFLRTPPRNYTVILLLTALSPSRGCIPCKQAFDEFQILATSWRYSKQRDNRLYFAVADFDNAPEVFEMLNQQTAPAIIYVSPKGSIKPSDYMDLMSYGFSAETVAKWISSLTSIQIRVFRPPSYTGTMLLALFMSVGAAALYFRRITIDCLYNTSLWSSISVGIILCAISGQVYNHIRGPPLLHAPPPKGEIKAFIYSGSDYQFIAETFIVMILYMASSGGILLMNEVGSTNDPTKRKVYTIGGIGLFSLSVSLILSVFRKKYQGYPFSLFFK